MKSIIIEQVSNGFIVREYNQMQHGLIVPVELCFQSLGAPAPDAPGPQSLLQWIAENYAPAIPTPFAKAFEKELDAALVKTAEACRAVEKATTPQKRKPKTSRKK